MEMKVVPQKGDLRDLQIMRTKTGSTLPQKGDEQQSLQKQLNCIGRRATEISYLSGIRNWERGPKKAKRAEMASIRQAQVLLRRREE